MPPSGSAATPASGDNDETSNKTSKIHSVVSHEEWIQARKELLQAEKAFSKQKAALVQQRRDLPWEEVTQDYEFEVGNNANGATTTIKLSQLCTGQDETVIVWHFMFDDSTGATRGCHLCSFFLDTLQGLYAHLQPRVNIVAVALASPAALHKVATDNGWTFGVLSARHNSFQRDYGVHFPGDNAERVYNYSSTWNYGNMAPGLSVFCKRQNKVYHTYSTYAAGLADLNATFSLLDVTPVGRNEHGGGPNNMWWIQHKDEYEKDNDEKDEE